MRKAFLLAVFVSFGIAVMAQNSPQKEQKIQDTIGKRNPPRHRHADKDKKPDTKLSKEKNEGNTEPATKPEKR